MNRFLEFLDDHAGKLYLCLLALAILCFVIGGILRSGEPSTITIPLSDCKSAETGRQREEQVTYYTCASYDSKGNCTVQMPNFYYATRKEVRTDCSFLEWR